MRLGKATVVLFVSKALISVVGFLATFYIARTLGPGPLGVYTVVLAVLFWLNIPTVAIASAITKRVSEGRYPEQFLSAGFLVNGAIAFGLVVLVFLFGAQIDAYVGEPVHRLLGVLIAGYVVFESIIAGLQGRKKVAQAEIWRVVERVVRTGLQVLLIVLGFEVTGLLLGNGASLFLAAILATVITRFSLAVPARRHFRELTDFAQFSWLGTLKGRAFGSLDTLILAFFVQSSLIGIYQVSWNLASLSVLASTSIQQVLFPEMSELAVGDQYDEIHHYLNEGLVFTGLFALPGVVGAAVIGARVLKIYRPEFSRGAVILVILIAAQAVYAYGSQFINAVNAIDRPDIAFRINLTFIGVNLVFNVVLVYVFGWYGAAIATSLSGGVALLLGYRALTGLIGAPDVPYTEIGREAVASLVMAGAVLGVEPIFPGGHYGTVALVTLGITIYGITLLVLSERIRQKTQSLISTLSIGA